ncbi:unnamed protein product [Linum tenue]|uniref:Uncharacterized protein n=2 Tax=Linum tenue TaxID=586396 RepID=A0AAV0IFV5_9ROSI|nr:unnamed protein product [Linum tenue]
MSVLKLNSDNQFIRSFKGYPTNIFVYDYMDDPNVFEMIHASNSRWSSPTAVGPTITASYKALEVSGVTIGGDKLTELAKDLTLTDRNGQTFHLIVNRQGLCFVYVASQPIMRLRINDRFGWSKYGVKPRISTVWSVWDMSSGAVLVAPPANDGTAAGGGEKYSALNESWKKVVEEKEKVMEEKERVMKEKEKVTEEKESLLRKSLEEKEKEVIALKAVVTTLSGDY